VRGKRTNWDFLGEEAGQILREADRARRKRGLLEKIAASGDPALMRDALLLLDAAREKENNAQR
jgi:hypothetical protein